ncbi:MAG: hypothetical protein LBN43_05015 [Oscillospiraceae bacterium]|jgi:hypothetical protein|nr:hypothetical protein [Oscillospiraceae bacterium]
MEKHTEQIKKFSEVIYALLRIAFVAFIIAGIAEIAVWIVARFSVSPIFKVGNMELYLPVVFIKDGYEELFSLHIGIGEILQTVFTIVALKFAESIFKILKTYGSPFREDVVQKFKRLAIALLCVGVVTGVVGFLAAGIVWVLRLIFDYGCALQNESDTTL